MERRGGGGGEGSVRRKSDLLGRRPDRLGLNANPTSQSSVRPYLRA